MLNFHEPPNISTSRMLTKHQRQNTCLLRKSINIWDIIPNITHNIYVKSLTYIR